MENTWLALFNKCLETGHIPREWRKSTIKTLYKGKGDPNSTDAYRGIALQVAAFKILSRLLVLRISPKIEEQLPDELFGFRRNRSTIMATESLIRHIQEELDKERGKMYVIFVDFSKAFDMVHRNKLLEKLRQMYDDPWTLNLISNILSENYVQINDSISQSKWLTQTNGVLQGDPLSPLLFNILMHDVVAAVKQGARTLSTYIYADDLALASNNRDDLQKGMNSLIEWSDVNELKINQDKTELVIFRKGGRMAGRDEIYCKGRPLKRKNMYKYLGITLQMTAKSFSIHIRERLIGSVKAINDIKNIQQLSMETALRLFEAKILPTLTYGIEIIWEYLTEKQLKNIEALKPRFLKRAMGLSKYTPSYVMAKETFLLDDLTLKHLLPKTPAVKAVLRSRREKEQEIWEDFYSTEAVWSTAWRRANQEQRHVVTRLAVHGFHTKLCTNKKYHTPNSNCVCELCNKQCDRYHIIKCKSRTETISGYANSNS